MNELKLNKHKRNRSFKFRGALPVAQLKVTSLDIECKNNENNQT